MPCRDDYEYENCSVESELRRQNDKLARIACSALNAFEKADAEACAKFLDKNEEADHWLTKHKAADAAEKARRQKEKDDKRLRTAALNKLTPDERKALGV